MTQLCNNLLPLTRKAAAAQLGHKFSGMSLSVATVPGRQSREREPGLTGVRGSTEVASAGHWSPHNHWFSEKNKGSVLARERPLSVGAPAAELQGAPCQRESGWMAWPWQAQGHAGSFPGRAAWPAPPQLARGVKDQGPEAAGTSDAGWS